MPLITIKMFEDELSDSQTKDLIHQVYSGIRPVLVPAGTGRRHAHQLNRC